MMRQHDRLCTATHGRMLVQCAALLPAHAMARVGLDAVVEKHGLEIVVGHTALGQEKGNFGGLREDTGPVSPLFFRERHALCLRLA